MEAIPGLDSYLTTPPEDPSQDRAEALSDEVFGKAQALLAPLLRDYRISQRDIDNAAEELAVIVVDNEVES